MGKLTQNQRRARRIQSTDYYQDVDPETCVTDLLSDLRHFCDAHQLDFAKLDHRAYQHYTGELELERQRRTKK